jgi:DNA replication protein DnaC
MTAAQLERRQEPLQRLRLFKSRERLQALLPEASARALSYADCLEKGLSEEVGSQTAQHLALRTRLARFPFGKGVEAFDLGYPPSLDKKQVQSLAHRPLLEPGAKVVILGPAGVGKTQLAVGLGLQALAHGDRGLFSTAANLIRALTQALAEGRLQANLKLYPLPRLLIREEIGDLPLARPGANLFLQLLSRRDERGPPVLTRTQSFGAWGEVFGDRGIATALLDRVLPHAITIRGHSYRLKETLKAGLVRAEETPAVNGGWEIFNYHHWGKLRLFRTLCGVERPFTDHH